MVFMGKCFWPLFLLAAEDLEGKLQSRSDGFSAEPAHHRLELEIALALR